MKKGNSILLIVFIMALVSFLCLSLSVSYSFIVSSAASSNTQTITTGNIESSVSHSSANLAIERLSDEKGLTQDAYGIMEISKNNNYSVFYNISLSYSLLDIPSTSSQEDLLPPEYIKVALFEINNDVVEQSPVMGPVLMADLPVTNANINNAYDTSYLLSFGTFAVGSDSSKYALKVWIDESADPIYNDSLIILSMNVTTEPLISKSLYNIAGQIYNGSSTLYGATIEIQNGSIKVTSGVNGTFNLTNVPEGTYNFKVTYNSDVYETNIHVKNGNTVNVQKIGETEVLSGTYLQHSAYTYYSTPYKIIKRNNIVTPSVVASSASYIVPASYVITGEQSISVLDIPNLKIDISSANLISLS